MSVADNPDRSFELTVGSSKANDTVAYSDNLSILAKLV